MLLYGNINSVDSDYYEILGAQYKFDPVTDHVMSNNSSLFDIKKAAKMYFWYQSGNRRDTSIVDYFDEYKKCIDNSHAEFNSNYGYYAYNMNGLRLCINRLLENKESRQACFCINNNAAMSDNSIDKLCTNVIQFFIRDNKLKMIVQMRSSNFITLLPYDAFMFSVFYMQVYKSLKKKYADLKTDYVYMQVASLHFYKSCIDKIKQSDLLLPRRIIDFNTEDCQEKLEEFLTNKLTKL